MDTSSQSPPSELDRLREQFPGWTFGSVWITANSGPDRRRLWAARGAAFISAWSAGNLAAEVRKYTLPGQETSQS